MLFNSYEFLLVFLPLAFVLFWYGGRSIRWRLGLLTFASYVFYSWWQFRSWDDFIGTFHAQSLKELAVNLWRWRFTIIMLLTSSVDYWAAKLDRGRPAAEQGPAAGVAGPLAQRQSGPVGVLQVFRFLQRKSPATSASFSAAARCRSSP